MSSILSPRLAIPLLMFLASVFAANHIAARVAFDHGASVAAAVAVRSGVTALVMVVVQTDLERDVRNLRNIGGLTLFPTYLRALAGRSAQLLNLSELARDVTISVSTARDWLSILEASFQVFILRPYFANIGKRLVKSPKVYFMDTGLLSYLVGLRDVEHAAAGPMGGAIFENLVAAELYKTLIHRGEEPAMYFWRTPSGSGVDLVVDIQGKLLPIEVKLSATPRPDMAREIVGFHRDFGDRALPGYVVHPGDTVLPLGGGAVALPFVVF